MKTERIKFNSIVAASALRLSGGRAELSASGGFCRLALLSSGSVSLTYGDSTTPLNPGCVVVLGTGVSGLLQQTGRTVPEVLGCRFPLTAINELRTAPQKDFVKLLTSDKPAVLHGSAMWNSRLRTLLELMRASQDETDYPALEYLELVLHYIGRQYAEESLTAARPKNETVEQICAYLSANYAQKLSLTEVATQFYISPYYLSRLFRRATGSSIVDYINSRRIEAAQLLLETTDLSISSVAEQTGFSTAANFRRVFRELMGVGPLQYRKAHKNG